MRGYELATTGRVDVVANDGLGSAIWRFVVEFSGCEMAFGRGVFISRHRLTIAAAVVARVAHSRGPMLTRSRRQHRLAHSFPLLPLIVYLLPRPAGVSNALCAVFASGMWEVGDENGGVARGNGKVGMLWNEGGSLRTS